MHPHEMATIKPAKPPPRIAHPHQLLRRHENRVRHCPCAEMLDRWAQRRRRLAAPRPNSPAPKTATETGSGTFTSAVAISSPLPQQIVDRLRILIIGVQF